MGTIDNLEKAILTLTSIKESSQQKDQYREKHSGDLMLSASKHTKKPHLDWLPAKYQHLYEATDLLYSFCVEVFSKVEANMRENIPETTMRSWFIEFIKAGWTQKMVVKRYNALIKNHKYGSIDFASWVNAVPVFAEDEINRIVNNKIESIIERGKKLIANKDKFIEITEEDKKAIELALVKEIEYELHNERLRILDKYKEEKKKAMLMQKINRQ